MDVNSCMNGIQHSLAEIDQELIRHIPELRRRQCTPRVMAEVDALLDQRNLIRDMGAVMLEETYGSQS